MQADTIVQVSTNGQSGVPLTPGSDIDADILLQASRRIDWRFLLPSPELGQVACLGRVSADMMDSLRLFSASMVHSERLEDGFKHENQFDLVVVEGLSDDKLRLVPRILKPGGYLYAEIENLLSPKRKGSRLKQWRYSLPVAALKTLRGAGFEEINAYWHWPNFQACNRIIPLNDRGALQFSMLSGSRTLKGRLRSNVGRGLLWTRLLEQSVTNFSIIARWDGS